jgi:Type I restriction modification DNA specificity domain
MRRLADIAAISMGATFAGKGGDTAYLRLANVMDGRIIGATFISPAPLKGLDAKLQVDDIVVRTRGPDLTAAVIGEDHAGAYASVDLFVVRVNRAIAEPAFVVAYINQPTVQATLAQGAQGTGFVRLNRPELADLEIPLPPLPQQQIIGSLALEGRQESKILNEIAERRARLHTELLHQAMAKARAGEIHPLHGHNSGLNDAVTSSALPSVPKQKVSLK